MYRKQPYICVIGGANIDFNCQCYPPARLHTSNPGAVYSSFGGVARNIAENLARLDLPVYMITALGADDNAKQLSKHLIDLGVQLDSCIIKDAKTSSYISVLDETGEMLIAVSAMDIFEKLTPDFIEARRDLIRKASICVLDTNLRKDVIKDVLSITDDAKVYMDFVSVEKTQKIKSMVGQFHTIKPNRLEAEALTGMKIDNKKSIELAADSLLKQGVKQVVLSLGDEGVYYCNEEGRGFLPSTAGSKFISTSGAGDALMSGLVYAGFHGLSNKQAVWYGLTASSITMENKGAVNPLMNSKVLKSRKESLQNVRAK